MQSKLSVANLFINTTRKCFNVSNHTNSVLPKH